MFVWYWASSVISDIHIIATIFVSRIPVLDLRNAAKEADKQKADQKKKDVLPKPLSANSSMNFKETYKNYQIKKK